MYFVTEPVILLEFKEVKLEFFLEELLTMLFAELVTMLAIVDAMEVLVLFFEFSKALLLLA